MTETTPKCEETWEEFLAEDVEYTKLNQQRSELDAQIRKYDVWSMTLSGGCWVNLKPFRLWKPNSSN